jgi:hypothetical protein
MMAIAIKTIETCDSYCYNYDGTVTCPTKAITYFISSYPGFLAFPATAPTLASTPAQQPMATNTRDYSCMCCHSDSFAPFYLLSLLFKKKKNCNTEVSPSKQKNLNFRQD